MKNPNRSLNRKMAAKFYHIEYSFHRVISVNLNDDAHQMFCPRMDNNEDFFSEYIDDLNAFLKATFI